MFLWTAERFLCVHLIWLGKNWGGGESTGTAVIHSWICGLSSGWTGICKPRGGVNQQPGDRIQSAASRHVGIAVQQARVFSYQGYFNCSLPKVSESLSQLWEGKKILKQVLQIAVRQFILKTECQEHPLYHKKQRPWFLWTNLVRTTLTERDKENFAYLGTSKRWR